MVVQVAETVGHRTVHDNGIIVVIGGEEESGEQLFKNESTSLRLIGNTDPYTCILKFQSAVLI
jgi:hypothetical protein